ncbi:Nam8 protein [Saccharomycopsis crataegensis]|uniref:Nam8 protein n=1 Tax=Saccharomycopsis crataegensis TaxID=43959 RepID=A0AAV5QWE2_9ASCO|nr:Nam8 protein [Saccharomycopsis crataegensis]
MSNFNFASQQAFTQIDNSSSSLGMPQQSHSPVQQQFVNNPSAILATPQQQQQIHSSPSSQQQQQSKEKSQLWMGELDPWWDESTIRSIWSSLGENVINVKLIKEKSMDPNASATSNNAGYCFVDFGSYLNASKAIMKNGLLIPGTNKVLKLNWASGSNNFVYNSNNNPLTPSNNSMNGNMNESSIFVGDLANDVKEHDLFELFKSRYPSVTNAKIMMDPVTGTSRGYGFIRFANDQDQQRALIEMNGIVVNGRPLRVSTAVPKNSVNNSSNPVSATPLFSNSPSRPIAPQTSQFQPPLNQYTDPNNTTVFVGGLSNGVSEQQLRSFFQSFGDIIYVKVLNNKGCGFVQYVLRSSAENAIQQMQGYPIGNSRIRLSWGRSSVQNNQNQQKYLQQLAAPNLYTQFNSELGNLNSTISTATNLTATPASTTNFQSSPSPTGISSNISILGSVPMNSTLFPTQTLTPQQQQQAQGLSNGTGLAAPVPTGISNPNTFNLSSTLGAPSIVNSNSVGNVPTNGINTGSMLANIDGSTDQLRLNTLLNAARDGRLDRVEASSGGFIYA